MRKPSLLAGVGVFALTIAGLAPGIGAALAADGLLSGAIKSAAGEKMGGVTVSARADGSAITTSVFTDENGNYYFPPLAEGKYQVWAQALTFDAAKNAVALNGNQHQDFTLKPFAGADPIVQLPGDEMLAALPGDTPDDARMKTLVRKNCTGCHSASFPLQHKFDAAGWSAVLELMKHINSSAVYKGAKDKAYATIDGHQKELAAYLARARGPGQTSMKVNLRPRPSGEAARVVFKEYDAPVEASAGLPYKYRPDNGSDWSLGTPSSLFGNNEVHDVVQDLDGNMWTTHSHPSRETSLGRIDVKTGEFRSVKVGDNKGFAASTHGIIRDAKGIIWFNEKSPVSGGGAGGLARLDPKTEKVTLYVPSKPMAEPQGSLDFDSKGNIWITTNNGALRFDPVGEQFTEFKSNEFKTPHGEGVVYGIAGDREGNGWWLDMRFDRVQHGDIASLKTTDFQLPPDKIAYDQINAEDKAIYANYVLTDYNNPFPWSQGPRRMGADKNGDFVWIADSFGGNLAKVDIHTMKAELVPLPNSDTMQPYHVEVDKNHNPWTNLWSTDSIAKYDQAAKKWTVFDLPSRGTESRYLSLLETDAGTSVAISADRTGKVQLMTMRSDADIAALKAKADAR